MKVKKYTAPTMPEAMKIVRSELGRSAVILNSREQKTKGFLGLFRKKYIEVFAAIDPQPRHDRRKESTPIREAEFKIEKSPKRPNHQIVGELETLRMQLNQANHPTTILPEEIQVIISELEHQEIEQVTINELTTFLLEKYYGQQISEKERLWDEVKQYFIEKLQDISDEQDVQFESKFVYLFGPTGVGKTTTIAKLASSQSITEGKKVALITLDTYRIAAIDQLKTYAKILNVPIEVAYSKEDLVKAKEKFQHYDLVFIDSAGRNYRKDEYIRQIEEYVDCKNEEVYCVLSITSKQKDIEEIYNRFAKLNINRVIFTKVDETKEYGPIYNLWNNYRFKVSYLTHGQSVPDDIQEASPELIVNMLVGEKKW